MGTPDHHMPDMDVQKISLLPMREPQAHQNGHNGRLIESNGNIKQRHKDDDRPTMPPVRRKSTFRNESLLTVICQWTVEHQIGMLIRNIEYTRYADSSQGISINLLLLHTLTHICFPRARPTTRKFYQIAYFNPSTGKFAAGWDDLYLVLFSIIVLMGLRAATLDYILLPIAQLQGITKRKEKIRFAEQAWILLYGSIFWTLGMVRRRRAQRGDTLTDTSPVYHVPPRALDEL